MYEIVKMRYWWELYDSYLNRLFLANRFLYAAKMGMSLIRRLSSDTSSIGVKYFKRGANQHFRLNNLACDWNGLLCWGVNFQNDETD